MDFIRHQRNRWRRVAQLASIAFGLGATALQASPTVPSEFCAHYPDAASCRGGRIPDCTLCHANAPNLNDYGTCLRTAIRAAGGTLEEDLASALATIEDDDCDGDGVRNLEELLQGSGPGDANDRPRRPSDQAGPCDASMSDWNVCGYDLQYVFRRIHQDFCGASPSFEELEAFRGLSSSAQDAALDAALDTCLASEHWLGKDGVLWRIAHPKIQPLRTIKSGADGGTIPLGDYDDDYNLFVYHQLDGRDVRGVLLADYFVARTDNPTSYTPIDEVPMHPEAGGIVRLVGRVFQNRQQFVPRTQRAGMLTTLWNSVSKTMFTSVPRTNAAQAMRAFLNLDIAKGEGLVKPEDPNFKLIDYDAKGVTDAACAFCHEALDAATYPFTKFNGLSFRDPTGGVDIGGIFEPNSTVSIPFPNIARGLANNATSRVLFPGIYKENRIDILAEINADTEPGLAATPSTGFLLGKPVRTIREWAEVAANSEYFAKTVALDYWTALMGRAPSRDDAAEYEALWRDLMTTHGYSVEAMLRQLIRTEAYGAP